MDPLTESIEKLSREEVLEATGFFANSLGISGGDQRAIEALQSLADEPYRNIQELEELARISLLTAAADPQYRGAVQQAVDGVGQKQFLLGGAEIVVLASLALCALQTVVSKGAVSEEVDVKITTEGDKRVVEIQKRIKYGITEKLADVLRGYFGIGRAAKSGM